MAHKRECIAAASKALALHPGTSSQNDCWMRQVTKVFIPAAKPDKPNREYGFVHFAERASVEKLVADAENGVKPELDGNTLEACVEIASKYPPGTMTPWWP